MDWLLKQQLQRYVCLLNLLVILLFCYCYQHHKCLCLSHFLHVPHNNLSDIIKVVICLCYIQNENIFLCYWLKWMLVIQCMHTIVRYSWVSWLKWKPAYFIGSCGEKCFPYELVYSPHEFPRVVSPKCKVLIWAPFLWQVRVNALLCLGDLVSTLDKHAVLEVLQTIHRCTAVDRSAPTLMCTLGVASSILKQVTVPTMTQSLSVFGSSWLFIIDQNFHVNSSWIVWSWIYCGACTSITHASSHCPTTKCSAVCQTYALCQGYPQVSICVAPVFVVVITSLLAFIHAPRKSFSTS